MQSAPSYDVMHAWHASSEQWAHTKCRCAMRRDGLENSVQQMSHVNGDAIGILFFLAFCFYVFAVILCFCVEE
jgi:hypothetical protein